MGARKKGNSCLSQSQRVELRDKLAEVTVQTEELYPLRLYSLLLMDAGINKRELAEMLGMNPRTLYKWWYQFREKGAAGLQGKRQLAEPAHHADSVGDSEATEDADGKKNNRPAVSLRDVASVAKVSLGAVSLALSGRRGVSDKTIRHVRAVAAEINYKPHPYVSTLMKQVRQRKRVRAEVNLAWLHYGPFSYKRDFKLPYGNYTTYAAALNRARELGYAEIEPFWCTEPRMTMARLRMILKNRGILGALVGPGRKEHFSELSDITLVKLGGPFLDSVNHHVYSDNYQSMLLACSKLWQSGYRRIGLLLGKEYSINNMGRLEAAWNDFQAVVPDEVKIPPLMIDSTINYILAEVLQQPEQPGYIRPSRFLNKEDLVGRFIKFRDAHNGGKLNESKAREAIHYYLLRLWVEHFCPDAILCADNRIPGWLNEIGYRVPEDIGVAHLNLRLDTPGWSGVNKNWETIGMLAMETLDHLISIGQIGRTRHPVMRAVPGTWIEGATTRRRIPSVYPNDPYVDQWIRDRGENHVV